MTLICIATIAARRTVPRNGFLSAFFVAGAFDLLSVIVAAHI